MVAIGTFDGVHLGHQALIRTTLERSRALAIPCVALTFDRHPLEVLDPARAPTFLTSTDEKVRLLRSLGVDAVCVLPFDRQLSGMDPQAFAREVLRGLLNARTVCVGDGFRFGRGRSGSTDDLERFGWGVGFEVHIQPLLMVGGEPVSSSRVRELLLSGAVDEAAQLLGRPYALRGVVERGHGMGRKLGFATANLGLPERQTVPADGVYVTYALADTWSGPGACSIGTRPTFDGRRRIVEVHLLDFCGDLYDRTMEVRFLRRLRGQERYAQVEELVQQMREDVRATRRHFRPEG